MENTAFQAAANTSKPRWEWLEEKVTVKSLRDGDCGSDGTPSAYPGPFGAELEKAIAGKADDELVSRPEHAVFGLAMLGGGRVFGKAHLYGKQRSLQTQFEVSLLTNASQTTHGRDLAKQPWWMLVVVSVSPLHQSFLFSVAHTEFFRRLLSTTVAALSQPRLRYPGPCASSAPGEDDH